jgi:hypothetical protein
VDEAVTGLSAISFEACDRCGAVVAVKPYNRNGPPGVYDGGIDNEAAHAEWHNRQDELLTMLATNAQASARARLASLIKFLTGGGR